MKRLYSFIKDQLGYWVRRPSFSVSLLH